MSLYNDLLNAGLPVISASDETRQATFSRSLNDIESDLYHDIADPKRVSIRNRLNTAKSFAKNIPNWSTWNQADWNSYFDSNLSDTQADLVTSFAAARIMIKRQNLVIQNLVKLVIAMRDGMWPDLPE